MLWRKQKKKRMADNPQNYGRIVWQKFRQNKLAFVSLRILYFLIFVALFADFLANQKPLVYHLEKETHFPVLEQYLVDLKLRPQISDWVGKDWQAESFDWVIWPLVPYSPDQRDRANTGFASPFDQQRVDSWWFHHWMGTDQIGRDVCSGLIHGTRTALMVGIISMLIALIIGILLGSIGGFFGDRSFQSSIVSLGSVIVGLVLGIFWGFYAQSTFMGNTSLLTYFFTGLFICLTTVLLFVGIGKILEFIPYLGRKVFVPADLLIMRLIEIFNSIPGLLLLMTLMAIVDQPTVWTVILIIGFIRWTSIARFVRAEMLRIKNLEYIQAGRTLGFSNWYILFRHALPNAINPVLIVLAFGIASAILLEAALSFLGLGTASSEVTWGKLLNSAQKATKAWWLAVFPGGAIFIAVTIFNLIGEGISEALDSRNID